LSLGEYHYRLDGGRLAIPPPLRPLFKEGICFHLLKEGCLAGISSRKGAPVDGRGRVTVSSKLRQLVGIKDQAVVVFLDNYMEVWGEKNWESELNISQVEE